MQDRFDVFESAQDMMICELDKIVQKNELTPSALDYVDKIVDIIKDLDEIMDGEEAHATNEYRNNSKGYYGMRGSSYRGNMRSDYIRGGSRMGTNMDMNGMKNSQNDGKQEMLDHLYMAMDTASTEEERKRIQRMINEIEGK